jgi:cholera toxin transcriptional activator
MSATAQKRVFRFGTFEANEAAEELRKNGVRLKLHAQPFQVLLLLLERPAEVVTREEMRQRLWGDGTFVDFDHGLNTAINKIRDALNDSAAQPRYVETVAGKGYRFIAPVRVNLDQQKSETFAPAEVAARPATALAAADDLPQAPRVLVVSLLLAIQAMYLAFYVGALANLQEIHEIFLEAGLLRAQLLMSVLITSAAVLIPVRLFLLAAVAFRHKQLPAKFRKIFPGLLFLDLIWALSPFLLAHHINTGLALAMCAALVYLPFAQRSLVLMYARGANTRL